MTKMQSLKSHFDAIVEDGIRGSKWFRTAPAEFQKSAKIKILGVEQRKFSSMLHSATRPALVAECECGGEIQRFALLLDNSTSIQMID